MPTGRGPWPSVAVEPLKWGESKLRCTVTGFQNLMGKKECKLSYESFLKIYCMLKWYFVCVRFNGIYCQNYLYHFTFLNGASRHLKLYLWLAFYFSWWHCDRLGSYFSLGGIWVAKYQFILKFTSQWVIYLHFPWNGLLKLQCVACLNGEGLQWVGHYLPFVILRQKSSLSRKAQSVLPSKINTVAQTHQARTPSEFRGITVTDGCHSLCTESHSWIPPMKVFKSLLKPPAFWGAWVAQVH